MKELTQIVIIVVGLVLLAVFGWLVCADQRPSREKFDLDLDDTSKLVTPVSLGTTPTLTITTKPLVNRSKRKSSLGSPRVEQSPLELVETGLTKTSPVLVLVHNNTFIPGDQFLPTSYASPGLVEFAQYGSPKGLIKELAEWYGQESFKQILVLPSISLAGHFSSLKIQPDVDHNLVTVLTKVSPSQSLFATATANTQ